MTGFVDGVAVLACNCVAWVILGAAIIEIVRTPAGRFAHGWQTKIGRLAVAVLFCGVAGGLWLPVGAAVILAGLRGSRRQTQSLPPAATAGPRLPASPGGFSSPQDR